MKMKKNYPLVVALLFVLTILSSDLNSIFAQVTIGSLQNPCASLDVVANPDGSTADGIVAPRVSRKNLNDNESKYTEKQEGVIVYVTTLDGQASGQALAVKSEGYYYFDGLQWSSLKGLHVIKGITEAENHIYNIPVLSGYVDKGNGIT
jgi:hypothetical protein